MTRGDPCPSPADRDGASRRDQRGPGKAFAYGSRRVAQALRRDGLLVNEKRVQRVMRTLPAPPPRTRLGGTESGWSRPACVAPCRGLATRTATHTSSYMKTITREDIYLRPYHTLAELMPARSAAVSSRTKSGF